MTVVRRARTVRHTKVFTRARVNYASTVNYTRAANWPSQLLSDTVVYSDRTVSSHRLGRRRAMVRLRLGPGHRSTRCRHFAVATLIALTFVSCVVVDEGTEDPAPFESHDVASLSGTSSGIGWRWSLSTPDPGRLCVDFATTSASVATSDVALQSDKGCVPEPDSGEAVRILGVSQVPNGGYSYIFGVTSPSATVVTITLRDGTHITAETLAGVFWAVLDVDQEPAEVAASAGDKLLGSCKLAVSSADAVPC